MRHKITKYWFLLVGLLFILAFIQGCEHAAEKNVEVNNPNFEVELLFRVDSASVYRFYDNGHAHYFVLNGKGSTTCMQNYQQNKNATRQEEISTVNQK